MLLRLFSKRIFEICGADGLGNDGEIPYLGGAKTKQKTMFGIGEKVVCVDVSGFFDFKIADAMDGIYNTFPVLDGQYTVRGLTHDGAGILLEEIVNPVYLYVDGLSEQYWKASRFVRLSDLNEMNEALEEVKQILELEMT